MARDNFTEKDLRQQVSLLREQHPELADDALFVAWFLRAFVVETDEEAVNGLAGGAGDKSTDAVAIDDDARVAFLVQGKYRRGIDEKAEAREDVVTFIGLAGCLSLPEKEFVAFANDLTPQVRQRLKEVRERVMRRGYRVQLYFVTTGRFTPAVTEEARRLARAAGAEVDLIDGRRVLRFLADYLDGVAPPVPSLDLEFEAGLGVRVKGPLHRFDPKTDIEAWLFSMTDTAVAELYERAGERLFARNVRGFLGNTQINRGMETTLAKTPEFFWYYNNGITIVCDDALEERSHGREVLRVNNPQIVNGQQTARTLSRASSGKKSRGSVLVRVIRVPRDGGHFDQLVSRIVAATNWQNPIRASDLMATDRRQVELERELRKVGFLYLRKRMSKGEARAHFGTQKFNVVKKEEVAQAVAACDLDPVVVRQGKEGLFEEPLYGQVFGSADPWYYAVRYLLMREVGYAARRKPERAYAKWLVLHHVAAHLMHVVGHQRAKRLFADVCRRNLRPLARLNRAIVAAFKAALGFYRSGRGKGETAIDVSSFFKRRGLHKAFAKFWSGSRNRYRATFQKQWRAFEKALGEAAEA